MKKTIIRIHCETIAEAERLQRVLYGKHEAVKLIDYPRWTENGVYQFEVAGAKDPKFLGVVDSPLYEYE